MTQFTHELTLVIWKPGDLESAIDLLHMMLDYGGKLEHPERTPELANKMTSVLGKQLCFSRI